MNADSTAPTNLPPEADEPEPPTYEAERARRQRRRWLWGLPTVILLAAAAWFSVHPLLHAIKGWQARRLAAQSLAFADAGQFKEAADQARDAYAIYPYEPQVWRAWGRVLTRVGEGRTASQWWQKVADAGELAVPDRRDWVVAALAADAPAPAQTQLAWLLAQKPGPTPADLLLAARVAAWRQDFPAAVIADERVLADPRATPREQFSAAVQVLYLAAPDTPASQTAVARLAQIARAPASPLTLDALTLLAWRATQSPAPAPILPPDEIAPALETHPRAGPYHRLLALELRALAEPDRAAALATDAVRQFGGSDDEPTVAALLTWLTQQGRPADALQAVTPARAAQSAALALPYLDALGALGRYEEAKTLLSDPHLTLDPSAARMYLAVVRARLGETAGAAGEWDRALDAAGRDADKLLALGQFAAKNQQPATADAAFAQAIAAAPDRRPAYHARYQLAVSRGDAALAAELSAEITRRWPPGRE